MAVGLVAPAECRSLDGSEGSVAPSVIPDNRRCSPADHQHREIPEGIIQHSSGRTQKYQNSCQFIRDGLLGELDGCQGDDTYCSSV